MIFSVNAYKLVSFYILEVIGICVGLKFYVK